MVLNNSIMLRAKFSAKDVENKTVEIAFRNTKFTYDKNDFVNNGDGTYYVYCNELFAHELSDKLLLTVYETVFLAATQCFSASNHTQVLFSSQVHIRVLLLMI